MSWSVVDPRDGCSEIGASGDVRKAWQWCHGLVSRTSSSGFGRFRNDLEGDAGAALDPEAAKI